MNDHIFEPLLTAEFNQMIISLEVINQMSIFFDSLFLKPQLCIQK